MKTAILGAGTIIPGFLEAVKEVDALEVYAIFGREGSLAKLTAFQEKYGIPKIYCDYDALLADEEVEVVYVALPNHLHCAYAKKAAEHGKHVIVEKPFTSTYAEAVELLDTARKNHVIVFEAISNQYTPNYRKTKELVREVGDVKIVQLNYSQYSRRYDLFKEGTVLPVFDPRQSGGALMDLNVYNIHYVVGIFGKPAAVRYIANVERGIDTSGILTMEYPSFQCVCIAAKDCKAPLSINIQGDKGYIHSDDPANVYGKFLFGYNSGETKEYSLNENRPRLYHELDAFAKLALEGNCEQADAYGRHTLQVMAVLDEARRQAGIVFGDE